MSTRPVPERLATQLASGASGFAVTFDDVRMEDVAVASGIPRATLYYYFAGKEELLAFVLRTMLDDLEASVAIAQGRARDARGRLAAVVRAQLAHLAANPGASRLLLLNLGRAGRIGAIAAGIDAAFHAPVRQILIQGIEAGDLVALDVEVATTAVYGSVVAVGLQALLSRGGIDVDATAERLIALLWSGIAAPGPEARRARP